MADMEIVRQFNSELSTLYATKPPISKAKVTSITRLALKAVKYYKHVVQSLEKFVQKCRPEYKIPALYVIDSIIRQSRHQFGAEKDVFGPRFGRNITNSFQNFFKCLPEEQSKLIKVLNLWQKNKVYSPEVIQPLLNMAHTRPAAELQGSPKLDEDVKAVPADTTQPVVGHMAQHHAAQQPVAVETPQEQAYIALLQRQQEEQMQHIRELEARLQRQQQRNQQLQEGHPPTSAETGGEQSGEPKFQLPTEVFAQIQALAGMVNQPGGNPPGSYDSEQYSGGGGNFDGSNLPGNYAEGNPPDEYGQQYDQHQEYPPGKYEEQPMGDQNYQQSYMSGYEHQGFVDDFDYGDDQDDQQRMEEKKRQLEQEASRLKTTSSFEQTESMNARQHLEEQYHHQQQMVSNIPPQAVPESTPLVPETLQPLSESAISAFQPAFPAAVKPSRSRSRSPRERRHRDSEREYRDSASDRERERGRERQNDGSDRNRQRNRGDREDRDRTREDRDKARGDRDRTREKARGDRDERERPREERDRPREERERTRDGREKSREKSRENRDERERSREERDRPREERERARDRERGRESDKDTRAKEEQPSEEKKEVKIEKWVPPVKEGHVSVCSRTVWLGRMHRNTTKETLKELFQEFGEVQIIDMVPPRGCAYIQMAEREAAYHSLSSKQIVKQNYKLAWAPAKGAKEYKEHFDKELGVTYIPVAKLQESDDTISSLAEGGWIDPRTIPEALVKKEEAAAASNATGQAAGVLGVPLGPPPFTGMPPGSGVPPGMPRVPFPIPGLPIPGMMPPGINVPGMPGMQFPQGMGNMPFQRHPMNNRLPFMPGVNPFMMPGLLPGAPMPGMPPFFRGPPPMSGQPLANVSADAGQSQNGNQGEVAGQSSEGNQEGTTETQGENAPITQGTTESGFQGPPPDQGGAEGQNIPNNNQEAQGSEQFGAPNMGQGGGPPFQGGPPFHGGPGGPGGPPFQPQFGQQGQGPFHGEPRFQGPPPFNDQGGGRPGPWRPAGSDNHWRAEGRRWGQDDGPPNEEWGNEREHWGTEDEHWRHEDRWGRGNDRRGRRDRHSQDEWGREEHFDRRKRGRFDDDWGPPHDRHPGPHHDRHRGRPPFGRDHPPRFGPGRGRPFPMDGPPPFDERRPWMRDEQRGRWGEEERPFRGEEERPFRGDPMEQQSEAEQQSGFQGEQHGGGQPGRDPNVPWDGRHGDGHHGDHPRDIPSLMGSQFKDPSEAPGEDPGVPENVASQEEVAKGWAEINELKARLARNKNAGVAVGNSETAIAHVEGQAEGGDPSEQSDVSANARRIKEELTFDEQNGPPDIKPQIIATVAPVEEAAASSSQVGQEDNALENQVKVKIEAPEEGDMTWDSGENFGVSEDMNVDVPVPIIKDEPVPADEVSVTPNQVSCTIAGSVSSSQDEPMTGDEFLDRPKDESSVVVPDVASSQERMNVSEPGIQVANLEMEQNETSNKVDVGKDSEPVVESSVPEHVCDNMGSAEVNREWEDESRVSNDVSGGSDEVKMGSDEVKVESSVEFTKQSEEVVMGSEEVTMGSSHGNMESDEVDKGPSVVSMGSETAFEQLEVRSVETTVPENNPSQLETSTKSSETNAEFVGSIEEKSTSVESEAIEQSVEPTGRDQVSGQVERGVMIDEVPDFDKKSQIGIESSTLVQQEADTTSNVPSEVDQIVADPTDTSASESTPVPGDA